VYSTSIAFDRNSWTPSYLKIEKPEGDSNSNEIMPPFPSSPTNCEHRSQENRIRVTKRNVMYRNCTFWYQALLGQEQKIREPFQFQPSTNKKPPKPKTTSPIQYHMVMPQ